MTDQTATVEMLTAEVRVLMIGSQRVTLSIYRQLDMVKPEAIEPFGRVRSGEKWLDIHDIVIPHIGVVGRIRGGYTGAGTLARSRVPTQRQYKSHNRSHYTAEAWDDLMAADNAREEERSGRAIQWSALPLIVLSGLR